MRLKSQSLSQFHTLIKLESEPFCHQHWVIYSKKGGTASKKVSLELTYSQWRKCRENWLRRAAKVSRSLRLVNCWTLRKSATNTYAFWAKVAWQENFSIPQNTTFQTSRPHFYIAHQAAMVVITTYLRKLCSCRTWFGSLLCLSCAPITFRL